MSAHSSSASSRRPRIVVVGSVNRDHVALVSDLPNAGETVAATEYAPLHGGKGANQAVAAARLGGEVRFIGAVGDDTDSRELMSTLVDEGIDVSLTARREGTTSGVALVLVDEDGENFIAVHPGANGAIELSDETRSAIADADVVLMQLEIPIAVVTEAALVARGVVIVNAAPATVLTDELVANTDILIVNEHERETALGGALPTGDLTLITTLGSRGATITTAHGSQSIPAFAVNPADTTGAGDTFCGAFAVAVSRGESFEEAVAWGNRAGALATLRVGARTAMPTVAEMEAHTAEAT